MKTFLLHFQENFLLWRRNEKLFSQNFESHVKNTEKAMIPLIVNDNKLFSCDLDNCPMHLRKLLAYKGLYLFLHKIYLFVKKIHFETLCLFLLLVTSWRVLKTKYCLLSPTTLQGHEKGRNKTIHNFNIKFLFKVKFYPSNGFML